MVKGYKPIIKKLSEQEYLHIEFEQIDLSRFNRFNQYNRFNELRQENLQIQNSVSASTSPDLTLGADGSYGYIQTWNSKPLLLNDQGNIVYAYDFRPTIIYDRNDTGYYVDPNSTSNMSAVTATNFRMGNALYLGSNNYYINNNGT